MSDASLRDPVRVFGMCTHARLMHVLQNSKQLKHMKVYALALVVHSKSTRVLNRPHTTTSKLFGGIDLERRSCLVLWDDAGGQLVESRQFTVAASVRCANR